MSGQVIDPFHGVNVKYPGIEGHCPLRGPRLTMFTEQTCVLPDQLEIDGMEGDYLLDKTADITFAITSSKRLHVSIGEFNTVVKRVSGLPGTDKIIRPADRLSLPSGQRRLYQKLTQFLNGKKVYVTGTFDCLTTMTGATEHDYDIRIHGDRPFPVSVDHTELDLQASPQFSFSAFRRENCTVYHPYGSRTVNIADAGDPICYFGAAIEDEPQQRCATEQRDETAQQCTFCDSPTFSSRIWFEMLFDGSGESAALFYPDCVESMRRMSVLVRPEDMTRWKRARGLLTERSELYVSYNPTFAEQAIYGDDDPPLRRYQVSTTSQVEEILQVPTREELLLRVIDDGRSIRCTPKDACMVYIASEPQRYRKDLLTVGQLHGIFYAGGYSHPYLDLPRRWNIVDEVAWPSVNGAIAEPLAANVVVGGKGHPGDDRKQVRGSR